MGSNISSDTSSQSSSSESDVNPKEQMCKNLNDLSKENAILKEKLQSISSAAQEELTMWKDKAVRLEKSLESLQEITEKNVSLKQENEKLQREISVMQESVSCKQQEDNDSRAAVLSDNDQSDVIITSTEYCLQKQDEEDNDSKAAVLRDNDKCDVIVTSAERDLQKQDQEENDSEAAVLRDNDESDVIVTLAERGLQKQDSASAEKLLIKKEKEVETSKQVFEDVDQLKKENIQLHSELESVQKKLLEAEEQFGKFPIPSSLFKEIMGSLKDENYDVLGLGPILQKRFQTKIEHLQESLDRATAANEVDRKPDTELTEELPNFETIFQCMWSKNCIAGLKKGLQNFEKDVEYYFSRENIALGQKILEKDIEKKMKKPLDKRTNNAMTVGRMQSRYDQLQKKLDNLTTKVLDIEQQLQAKEMQSERNLPASQNTSQQGSADNASITPSVGPSDRLYPIVRGMAFQNPLSAKDWHQNVTQESRHDVVVKIVIAMFPIYDLAALEETRVIPLVQYAKQIENDMYKMANSHMQYYQILAEATCMARKQVEEKFQDQSQVAQPQQVRSNISPLDGNASGMHSPKSITTIASTSLDGSSVPSDQPLQCNTPTIQQEHAQMLQEENHSRAATHSDSDESDFLIVTPAECGLVEQDKNSS